MNPTYLLAFSVLVFSVGIYGLATTRNLIRMLLSAEVMLNGALLALITVASVTGSAEGAAVGLIAIALSGAEVGIFISICILLFRCAMTLDAFAARSEEEVV